MRSLLVSAILAGLGSSTWANAVPFQKQHFAGGRAPSRKYGNKAGKYMPHQGKQECARRVRQMQERRS